MSLVFWDTMLFIYLMEDHPERTARVREIRATMLARGDRLCTSSLTLAEILAGPYAQGDDSRAAGYKAALRPPTLDILDFTPPAADHYARLRLNRGIARPDAMQLACAAANRVDLFLTHDRRLHGQVVPGIQFIAGLDVNLL